MRRPALAVACVVLWGSAAALEPDQIFDKASSSVLVVYTFDRDTQLAQGSGVVVASGKVVTSCRLLARSSRVRVERGNTGYDATLELLDPERDLCQLNVKDLNAPAVALRGSSTVRVGQRVYAIGSPKGVELTLAEGLISALRAGDDKDMPRLQVSIPTAGGSNGGGVFDTDGRLVGITTSAGGSAPAGAGFALPADWIRDLPRRGRENPARAKAPEAVRPASASAAPQTPGDANGSNRMPEVGDTWTYAALDLRYKPRDRSRIFVHTVQTVGRSSIRERVSVDGDSLGDFTFSPEPVGVVRAGMLDVAPFATAFGDLKPGDSFGRVPIRMLDSSGSMTVKEPWIIKRAYVAAREKVAVPAGTFDALKLVVEGQVHSSTFGANAIPAHSGYQAFTETVWYAPSVKRTVKSVTRGPNFTDAYELESFKLR